MTSAAAMPMQPAQQVDRHLGPEGKRLRRGDGHLASIGLHLDQARDLLEAHHAALGAADDDLLTRCSAVLRLAEQFERARDQAVRSTRVSVDNGVVVLTLEASEDVTVAQWAAERQSDVFERAFGKRLVVNAPG